MENNKEVSEKKQFDLNVVRLAFAREVLDKWYEESDDSVFGKWLHDKANEA